MTNGKLLSYLIPAKTRVCLSGIRITASTHVETVVLLSCKFPDSVINVKVEFGEISQKPKSHTK